ncbi:MAG: glycosyltransferase family 4 protein [Gammaproteobacteria bacterium]|nr:glycosyltransferase family 4 protein [Gammaproteobacteria bacterium]
MDIWIVEIGEPLPIEEGQRLLRYGCFSTYLLDNGHNVRWWTSGFSHQTRQHVVSEPAEINHNGVILDVIPGRGYQSSISLQRVLHQKEFANDFARIARTRKRPDAVIATVPSPEIARQVAEYCEWAGVPMILDIRDQWPEELVDLAPTGMGWLVRIALHGMYRDMSFACRTASAICSVSNNFLEYALSFAKRPRSDLDFVFPLGYEGRARYSPEELDEAMAVWKERGVREDHAVCCFFGAIGKYFQLEPIIEAARRLQGREEVQFVLCGKGVLDEHFRTLSSDCKNIIWPGWVAGVEVAALMKLSDIALAPYRADAKMQMPNKLFEYMSGQLPIVSSLTGEMAQLLDDNQCGLNYDANDSVAFEQRILQLVNDPERRVKMGLRGHELFSSKYTFDIVFKNAMNSIQAVVQKNF